MQATIHLIAPSMTSTTFTARVIPSISAVDAKGWDACANPPGRSTDEAEGERFNPFIAHAFLDALEASGSVGGRSGWPPAHVPVEAGRGRLAAAAPCYLKSHSQGEYVFDHAWADAYERAGGRYYPKLQVAAPFTPVTGRPLLVAPDSPPWRRGSARRSSASGGRRSTAEASSICLPDHQSDLRIGTPSSSSTSTQ